MTHSSGAVEAPQVQFIDNVVDMPVVMRRQVSMIQKMSDRRARCDEATGANDTESGKAGGNFTNPVH